MGQGASHARCLLGLAGALSFNAEFVKPPARIARDLVRGWAVPVCLWPSSRWVGECVSGVFVEIV
jgi:hypothetical protein